MDTEVRLAETPDLVHVAKNARECDKQETQAAAGLSVLQALLISRSLSDWAYAGYIDGEPACIFGVGSKSDLGITGVPWMIGTPLVDKYPMMFARSSIKIRDLMHYNYPILSNWVDARNERTIRWLKWLGFKFTDCQPYGVEQRPFWHFTRTRYV